MLKDYTQQVNRDCDYLLDIFENNRTALLENNLVLVCEVYESYLHLGFTVPIGKFTEEYKLVMAHGVFGGVYCLKNIYDTGHPGDSVKYDPVADDCRQKERCYLVHSQINPFSFRDKPVLMTRS